MVSRRESDWFLTSYLILSVDKHPSSTLQTNPAPTSVKTSTAVYNRGAGLVSQTSVTIQINFVSFSWCFEFSWLRICLTCQINWPKTKSLEPSASSEVGKMKSSFWIIRGGYFPESPSRFSVHWPGGWKGYKGLSLSYTNYNAQRISDLVLKLWTRNIFTLDKSWQNQNTENQHFDCLTFRMSVRVSISVSDVRLQNPLCPL